MTNNLQADGTPHQNISDYPSWGYIGMLCVDVSVAPPALCANKSWYQVGNDLLLMANSSNPTNMWLGPGQGLLYYNHHKGIWMPMIQRYFMLDAHNWKIQCWDATLKAGCAGFPVKINGSAALLTSNLNNEPNAKADIVGLGASSFYVQTDTHLYCFDVVGDALEYCGPGWPIVENSGVIAGRVLEDLSFSVPAFPHEYPIGTIDGVCNYLACFDRNGTVRDDWGASAYMRSVFTTTVARNYYRPVGLYATTMGRSYFQAAFLNNRLPTPMYCWDNILNQTCSGFAFSFPDDQAYTVEAHPKNPACLFWTTNSGAMGSFDAYTGIAGCATTVAPEKAVTDLGQTTCSGRRTMLRRIKFEVLSVTNGTVGDLKFTALSALGAAIPNYTQLSTGVGSPIDLRGLTLEMTGSAAQYLLTMSQPITGTPQVRYRLVYTGPGPEMCFTVIPTVNTTMSIPLFVETISHDSNNTVNAYNTTVNATPCS